jgi:hypothetical protein
VDVPKPSSTTASGSDRLIFPWEVILSLPGLVLTTLLVYQRHLVYSKGKWGLLSEDSGPLFIWALLSLVALAASRPWNKKTRYGSLVRGVTLLWSFGCLIFISLTVTGWGRYQIVRFETLQTGLGISRYGTERRTELIEETLHRDSGPWILGDRRLLQKLTAVSGPQLLVQPRSARAVLSSLLTQGITFEELWNNPQTHPFLLACLLCEADPEPWHRLEWVPKPALKPDTEVGLMTGLLSGQQAHQIVQEFCKTMDENDIISSEKLVFCLMNFPSLFEAGQPDLVMQGWARKFKVLEPLAVEGLLNRDQVKFLLEGAQSLTVKLQVKGLKAEGGPSNLEYFTVPRMVLGLIRSCGVQVKLVEDGPADLTVDITVHETPLYEYSTPTLDYETYYEQQSSRNGKYGYRTKQVRKERQVVTGHETKTQWAPMIRVEMTMGENSIGLEETLLFWHDLTYDHEKSQYLRVEGETVYGRMWPFGVDKDMFEFGFLTDIYSF